MEYEVTLEELSRKKAEKEEVQSHIKYCYNNHVRFQGWESCYQLMIGQSKDCSIKPQLRDKP